MGFTERKGNPVSTITLYKKPFERDHIRHDLLFLFRFALLGDIAPPDDLLYELELGDGTLSITAHAVTAMGSGYIDGLEVVGLDEIRFCSLDRKRKELTIESAERGTMRFWYRKHADQVEAFYNDLMEGVNEAGKIQS